MTYLLDTHTLIWAITQPSLLSPKVRALVENPEERIVVSAITFWEISLKFGLGKLSLENVMPDDFPNICKQMDIEVMPLDGDICASYFQLSGNYHKDPFDRMLLWLAKSEKFTLLSKDDNMKKYASEGINVVW